MRNTGEVELVEVISCSGEGGPTPRGTVGSQEDG